jgi:hypothetical protein
MRPASDIAETLKIDYSPDARYLRLWILWHRISTHTCRIFM